MAKPNTLHVKESIKELRLLQRNSIPLISKRLTVLIEYKSNEANGGISKRDLSAKTGINHNSILRYRKLYLSSGIDAILSHGRIGFKPSVFTEKDKNKIDIILSNPTNGIVGYTELKEQLEKELKKDLVYITLVKYVQRVFGAKVKVARKSHIKKDPKAVEAFKKTSLQTVKK